MAIDFTWQPKDKITAARLNAMIEGTEQAITTANAASSVASAASIEVQNSSSNISKGVAALNAIEAAVGTGNLALSNKFNEINNNISTLNSYDSNNRLNAVESAINNAKTTNYQTLASRLNAMQTTINDNKTKVDQAWPQASDSANQIASANASWNKNSLVDTLASMRNSWQSFVQNNALTIDHKTELEARIKKIDGGENGQSEVNGTLTHIGRIRKLEEELSAAHRDNIVNDTLDNRLDNIEANVVSIGKELGMVQDNQNIIDLSNAVERNNTRVDNLETEITNAKDTYNSIDARFDAVEATANAAAIKSDVDSALEELDTRLDAIDNGEALTGNSLVSRVSTIESNLTTIEGAVESKADASQTETALGNIETRLDAIDGNENNTIATRLSNAENAISHAAQGNDAGGLTQRIAALENEPKSATTIIDNTNIIYGSNGKPTSIGETPTQDKDYLLQGASPDTKYYYWKYIGEYPNGNWELISSKGGSGSSTSSALILEELPTIENADKNIDYYIGNNINGYIHYRYIPSEIENEAGNYIKILPKNLINSIGVTTVTATNSYTDTDAWPDASTVSGGLEAYTLEDDQHTINLLDNFVAVRNARINAVYPDGSDTPTSQTLQILDTKGHLIEYPIVGGSGGSAYSIRFLSTLSSNTFTVPQDSSYHTLIKAKAIVKQGNALLEGVSFSGEVLYQLSADSADIWHKSNLIVNGISNNTEFSIDVSSLLQSNSTTKIRLSVDINTGDGEPTNRNIDYTITKTAISISSTFNPSTILESANLVIHYTCQGVGLEKLVYFKIDGENAIDPILTSNHNVEEEVSIPLNNLTMGSHTLQIYFVTNGNVYSNKLNYYIIYNLDDTQKTPIIGANVVNDDIIDGEELIVNYTVYTPGKENTEKVEVELYVIDSNNIATSYDNKIYTLTNVPIENSQWKTTKYPTPITPATGQPEVPIKVRIKLTAYNTVAELDENQELTEVTYTSIEYIDATINRFTNPNNYNFKEVATGNLLYDYVAYGKSNNASDRENYTYNYIANDANSTELTFNGTFTGFNWATNGYIDGESLTISGGAKYNINVPIFSQTYNEVSIESQSAQDITQYGRTIEIDYEVSSATDLNATIIECMDPTTHAGFRITPTYCYLTNQTTPAEIDEQDGFILNESAIAAAYLQTNTRIHLAFVIEPWSLSKAFDKTFHQSVNIYINGEFANSCPYERDSEGRVLNSFTTDATMTLGSDTCILKVYSIKIYNRGLDHNQILQTYKLAPNALYDRLSRFEDNDVLTNNEVDYKKARLRFNCLLLKGPDPTAQATLDWPTISPYKGSPSPARRKKKATDTDYEGKTESGLILTKPSSDPTTEGYVEEFNLCDKVPVGAPAYLGAAGAYCSSNNVQGTSSQKYPLHNLKIYLAKWQEEKTTTKNVALGPDEEVPEGTETVEIDGITYKVVTETTPAQIKKVKYSIKGYDDAGNPLGIEESTLCWKADYMSTDHANTYNANIANNLFSDELQPNWNNKKLQNTVYGIRCMLFVQQGDDENSITFVGDGCLNNDKGNTKTFGLDNNDDEGNNTLRQKWEFTNNTSPLDVFKSDNLFAINEKDSDRKIFAKGAFECNYPDEGDLKDDGIEPNYNHLQLMLTWVNKRACYLDYSVYDDTDGSHVDYTVSDAEGSGGTYNGINYNTERELKKAIFKNEFETHFNLNHVLTYYLLSEYIALCDNRAKNMFMRSEDVRSEVIYDINGQKILDGNAYPDDGTLWNTFVNTSTGITNPSIINWNTTGENHSTFAKWAPVLYDLDSCFGVENVGLITIKYNADWQYKYNNKEAFSGFDSIFWLMVEDTYANELRTLATQLYNNELNFTNFYRQQITGNRNATCPAITNHDMILKYQKPWNEGFINYAEAPDAQTGEYPKQTPLYKYIQRGTRTTQKATFMRQRSMLLSSKYVSYEFTNSMISFRAGVQVTGDNTLLTLVANQDLYPAIMFGDSNTLIRPTKMILNNQTVDITNGYVPANVPFQISTSQIGNSDTVKIVGASVLNDIGDLSKYQPYELKVGSGANLKRLIIGSDAEGYINTSTETIEGLSDCALLEEINIQNTTKLSSLNLSGNGLIKRVYAKGSNATTITLPNGGVLEEIEYGAKTTNITLLNQKFLTTFTFENSNTDNAYNNLQKLWVENTKNVPIVDIISKRANSLTGGIRLIGIDIELGDDPKFLEILVSDFMKGKHLSDSGSINKAIPYPQITGTIHINKIRRSLLNKIQSIYGENLIIDTKNTTSENRIEFYNGTTLYKTFYLLDSEIIPDPTIYEDPITGQVLPIPTKKSDMEFSYTFNGWRYSGGQQDGEIFESGTYATTNYIFQANYATTPQYYNLVWKDNDVVLTTLPNLRYNESLASYPSPSKDGVGDFKLTTVKPPTVDDGHTHVFKGWDKALTILNLDNFDLENNTAVVNAIWEDSNIDFHAQTINITDFSTLNAADLYGLSLLEDGTQRASLLENYRGTGIINFTLGHDFDYSNTLSDNLLQTQTIPYVLNGNINKIIAYNDPINGIYPLKENESFTLALDFTMLKNTSNVPETILASCYYNNNNTNTVHGFKINYNVNNHQINIYWGNSQYVTIDNATLESSDGYRNIVVLSHLANSNDLKVYYRQPNSANTLPGTVVMRTLSDNYVSMNIPLILGGNYAVNSSTNEITNTIESDINTRGPAKAKIYFMKYWHKELKSDDCIALASWPHENISFVLTGYDNGVSAASSESTTITVGQYSKLNFASTSVIGDRGYNWSTVTIDKTDTNGNRTAGWHNSSIRDYCSTTIYSALPTTLQSILYKNQIPCKIYKYDTIPNTNFAGWILQDGVRVVDDYIYLPSAKELGDTNNKEAILVWPSASNQDVIVYEETEIQDRVRTRTLTPEENNKIQKIRFYYTDINFNKIVYKLSQNPKTHSYINSSDGSRIIPTNGSYWYDISGNNIYIYSEDEWKPAIIWSTRSLIESSNSYDLGPQSFRRISSTGELSIPSNLNPDTVRGVCIEFAVGG